MTRYIFNPEHDLCLASGDADYIPPASAVEFARRCSWIGKYMGDGEGAGGEIVPWGWDSALKKKLQQEGCSKCFLPDDNFLDFIRRNSRREEAVELLERLYNLPGKGGVDYPEVGVPGNCRTGTRQDAGCGILSPDYRIVARNIQDVVEFLGQRGRVVLKAPLSGSGKGIRFVSGELMETDRGWCRRIIERQGAVVVEERLEVVQEFAMLFEYDAAGSGGIALRFRGYSLFYASNGAYRGNLLASNGYIENVLGEWIAPQLLVQVRCGVERFLQERLQEAMRSGCRILRGYVGVDQFICRRGTGSLLFYNPAVEINFRMTMGHIARNIYDFHSEELGLGSGTHCFEPVVGIFPCREKDMPK